ncbi:MAG: 6-carboxytetrahydropterin synthase QueD [Synergistales bacterium]|nr:6-carboxytetrahydropterin synthase QueD [Synergistales bacterium]
MLLRKEFTFDAAHNLVEYHGKCERLHGHTYKLAVTLKGIPDKEGMIIDFCEVSSLVREKVVSKLDHAYLNDIVPQPTAEYIARWVWEQVEEHFTPFYSQRGRPSIPPRKLIGMMLLKERFSLSDEKVMKLWPENPYWQYFCGEVHFQTKRPFQTKELSNFRRRIGAEGLALIRSISLKQFGKTDDKTYKTYSDRRKRSFWRRIVGV